MKDSGETVKNTAPKVNRAKNSQAKGPDLDDTLESRNAPKKINLSGKNTERTNIVFIMSVRFLLS